MSAEPMMWMLYVSAALGALIRIALWLGVGGIGLLVIPRTRPLPRMLLVAAGLCAAALSVVWPIADALINQVGLANLEIDAWMQIRAGLNVLNTLLWLVPWGLLLAGLYRLARAVRDADAE